MTTQSPSHHVFILMGVSGSGKSAVANQVSHQLNTAFLDGDFLHPRANILKWPMVIRWMTTIASRGYRH